MARHWQSALVFLIAFLAGTGGLVAGQEVKVNVRLATIAPRGSELMTILQEMQTDIREQTGHEVGFTVFYGGVKGDEDQVLAKIRQGELDGGAFTGYGLGRIVPAVRVLELPYLFRNYGEVDYVRQHLYQAMERLFEEEGFVVLGWSEIGFVHTFSQVPVTSLPAAREGRWWLWQGDPLRKAMFDALGVAPVPLPFSQVTAALAAGRVDTLNMTPYMAIALNWYPSFRYMAEYPATHILAATVVKASALDRVSPENRRRVKAICPPYFDRMNRVIRRQNDKSIPLLQQAGIQVVPHDPRDPAQNALLASSRQAMDQMAGAIYPRELLEKTLALLAEYRRLHPDSGLRPIPRP